MAFWGSAPADKAHPQFFLNEGHRVPLLGHLSCLPSSASHGGSAVDGQDLRTFHVQQCQLEGHRWFEGEHSATRRAPYGPPSSALRRGILRGREVVLLSRHGRRHTIPPSQVNNRANVWALRELGCARITATAACGSLRAEIGRGAILVPDQFIDFTRHRVVTFHDAFSPGIENARHCPMADPFDEGLWWTPNSGPSANVER